jgi:hypothetical protein
MREDASRRRTRIYFRGGYGIKRRGNQFGSFLKSSADFTKPMNPSLSFISRDDAPFVVAIGSHETHFSFEAF